MSEQPPVPRFPRWLIVLDLLAALMVVAGLLLRNGVVTAGSLPAGTDLMLLGLGGFGIAGCAFQLGRFALAARPPQSSR